MRPIRDNTVIQIEITNACHLSCRNCTRHVGHHRKPFFMELEFIEIAIRSVLASPCRIGIMGGEPCLHPHFKEVLSVYADLVPIERREFWTAGFKWGEYEEDIKATFLPERIAFNDHRAYDGLHSPLLVAIDDVVEDPELRRQLIENCPYQTHWSASITPKGGFFCEIAASLDWLFDGPGGYDVGDELWWDRDPSQFQDQVARYCGRCSGAIPMPAYSDGRGGRDGIAPDQISRSNLRDLVRVGSPKVARGGYEVWDRVIDREFVEEHAKRNPRAYRSFIAHEKKDVDDNLEER